MTIKYRGKHVRLTLPDSTPTATCTCRRQPGTMRLVSFACPVHDPIGYAQYMAQHATDSISPVDRDPWSGRS